MSNAVGIALVLIGVACMVLGAVQHRSYVATLPPADIPRSHAAIYPILLCCVLAAAGHCAGHLPRDLTDRPRLAAHRS